MRFLCALLLPLFAAFPLAAQTTISAVAGPVVSRWGYPTSDPYTHPIVGFAAGAALAISLSPHVAFAPELLIVRKGASLDYPYGVKIQYQLGYLEMPVLLRYTARTGRAIRPFAFVGGEIAFDWACTSASHSFTPNIFWCTSATADPVSEDLPNRLDAGVIAGVGVARRRFSLSLRYDYGLTDIYSRYHFGESTRNVTWDFLFGVVL